MRFTYKHFTNGEWVQHSQWFDTYVDARNAAVEYVFETLHKAVVIDETGKEYCE
jgi:hypothetical protein